MSQRWSETDHVTEVIGQRLTMTQRWSETDHVTEVVRD